MEERKIHQQLGGVTLFNVTAMPNAGRVLRYKVGRVGLDVESVSTYERARFKFVMFRSKNHTLGGLGSVDLV